MGYYGEFGDTAEKMAEYAEEHGLVFTGPLFTYYLLDEISIIESSKYMSRIIVGVEKKRKVRR
jgi:effector-binding domain-containing protein